MIVDFRLQRVIKEIKESLKLHEIDLTEQQIEDIVDSQYIAVAIGMQQCDKIVLPFFGTFDIKKRTKFFYNISKANNAENNVTKRLDNKIKKIDFDALQNRK